VTPAQSIAEFAREQLRSIASLSGYVLYSAASTLCKGDVYLLGHNPGGSPEKQSDVTITASLDALAQKTINNYLDEAWTMASGRRFPIAGAPLQRRVDWLLNALELDTRQVAASNLIFARSIDAAGSRFDELASLCWPVHERIINCVQPRALLVFGNSSASPYGFLRARLGVRAEEAIDAGHPPWQCRAFIANSGLVVIGMPHLSRYNIIGKTSVTTWVRRMASI